MKYRVVLIVGRFQPFHFGHLFLIKKALTVAEKIVFGIGSASIYSEDNPLSFEQRKKMIEEVIKQENISSRVSKIVPLEDFFSDKKWLTDLEKQAGGFDLMIGNNEWTNKILEKAGYKILRIGYYKRYFYEGERIRKLIKEKKSWENRVPNYLVELIKCYMLYVIYFNHIVLGGTFDRLHKGHRAIINKAFSIGKKVTIGLATEKLYQHKFLSKTIESYSKRKETLKEYVKNHLEDGRLKVSKISDIYGPLKTARNVEAIVVSKATYPNALKINQLREKNNLPLLRIIIVKDVLAQDGKLISSERIREGKIDREGRNFQFSPDSIGIQKKHLIMPESLREELRKPIGKVFKTVGAIFKSPKKPVMVIAVGDIIVDALLRSGIDPDVKVIDLRSRREPIEDLHGLLITDSHGYQRKSATSNVARDVRRPAINQRKSFLNQPGTINLKTAEYIKEKIKKALYKRAKPRTVPRSGSSTGKKSWILIDGEEDLLALPAILFAPLNSMVLYGHWQLGIIAVEVDEKIKNKVRNIVKKFL